MTDRDVATLLARIAADDRQGTPMNRSHHAPPARDRPCRTTSFEIEIETLWDRLQKLRDGSRRTVTLDPASGRLVMRLPDQIEQPGEVGTYTGAVPLADLRADCFDAFDRMLRRKP